MTEMNEAQRIRPPLGPDHPITRSESNTEVPEEQTPFQRAADLYRQAGWSGTIVLPSGKKSPPPNGYTGYDGRWPAAGDVATWSGNIGLRLPDGVVGIDVDHYGAKRGADQLAELEARVCPLPPTWSSTRRGWGDSRIRFYRVPPGRQWPTKAATDIDVIQFSHRYSVVWPSVIDEDGLRYQWFTPEGEEASAPPRADDLTFLPDLWVDNPEAWSLVAAKTGRSSADGSSRSKKALLELMSDDPDRGNDWLARICGMLAPSVAAGLLQEDEAIGFVRAVDMMSDQPHESSRLEATWGSIFKLERKNHPDRKAVAHLNLAASTRLGTVVEVPSGPVKVDSSVVLDFSEDNGHLRDRIEEFGYEALIRESYVDEEGRQHKALTAVFSDFKLRATSVYEDDGVITWIVDFITKDGTVKRDREITSDVLANNAALKRWVMGHGGLLRYNNPNNTDKGDAGTRMQALLMSQNPPRCEIVSHLGWNEKAGVFVADQGVITPGLSAIEPFTKVRPTKFAIEHSRSRYGSVVGVRGAVDVFREVLTFHDETAASVVGSWAVMSVLRGHLNLPVFPILKVDGTAESGKSKFLEQVFSLVGHTGTGGGWTKATARTALGANASGIVWFDDCDGLAGDIQELLRQAATGGDATNRDVSDLSKLQVTRFRASAAISSEGLGTFFNSQKANRDRMVAVHFPDPKGRMSFKDPTRPQWDDVQELWFGRFNRDYTQIAGSLVAGIIELAPMLSQLKGLNKTSSRRSQTDSLILMGAMVLDKLTGDGFHVDRVRNWIGDQEDLGNASVVVLQMIPTLWRSHLFPETRMNDVTNRKTSPGVNVPVFWDAVTETFWVNVSRMADCWKDRKERDSRTESLTSEDAIQSELTNIGCSGSGKPVRLSDGGRLRYREIPIKYSQMIRDRATE